METTAELICGPAQSMTHLPDAYVDLVVTSPPYPMIKMWDGPFVLQDGRIGVCLSRGDGAAAFALMHELLDAVWAECARVMKPGAIACINIGDATRTLEGDFQLYSNHARILSRFLDLGLVALPDILWRKPTNAPSKFMGSGMLPVGAYVTYEHEYILVLRKGRRRKFTAAADKARRRTSAFFWEERNTWFSDVWSDIRGTDQQLPHGSARQRSAAFPLQLAYRLVCMFSIHGDVVLDPFAGTGTTLAAALAGARNAVGVELDPTLLPVMRDTLDAVPHIANQCNRTRLVRHVEWASARAAERGPLKYRNHHYGFPVVSAQEQDLLLRDVEEITAVADERALRVRYRDQPQADFVQAVAPVDSPPAGSAHGRQPSPERKGTGTPAAGTQLQLGL